MSRNFAATRGSCGFFQYCRLSPVGSIGRNVNTGSSIIIMIITSCAISTAMDYGSCCFDVFVLQCFVLL